MLRSSVRSVSKHVLRVCPEPRRRLEGHGPVVQRAARSARTVARLLVLVLFAFDNGDVLASTATCDFAISCPPGTSMRPGDTNCNGRIDAEDLVFLERHLYCEECPDCESEEAFDANLDGALSAADLSASILVGSPPTPSATARWISGRTTSRWNLVRIGIRSSAMAPYPTPAGSPHIIGLGQTTREGFQSSVDYLGCHASACVRTGGPSHPGPHGIGAPRSAPQLTPPPGSSPVCHAIRIADGDR